MDFDSFLGEDIHRNSIRKRDLRISGLSIGNLKSRPRVKETYNELNKLINQTSTKLMGNYVVIPPTVIKSSKFVVLDIAKANAALWKLYDYAINNPKNHAEDDWQFETIFDKIMSDQEIVAAYMVVDKVKIPGFEKGYAEIGTIVGTKHQGQGLMYELYKMLILQGIPLMSDNSHSPGAIKLWEKLYNTPGISMIGVGGSGYRRHTPLVMTPHGIGYTQLVHHSDDDYGVEYLLAYKGK